MAFVQKQMMRLMGKAVHSRRMIEDGDRILIGVSGGKDSLSLLYLMKERARRLPIDYHITAVHVDPGFGGNSADKMEAFFRSNDFEYRVFRTDIGIRAHSKDNRENPCFLCSRLRRKILFDLAGELNCNKIALGHHKDDVIETFFLNMFYGASLSTMLPVQELFQGRLKIIRPLYLIEEDLIRRYAVKMNWEDIDLGCPTAGLSKRREIKEMLLGFYRTNRKIRGNIFHALNNTKPEYLP